MNRFKMRDEQKGIFFLSVIFLIILAVIIVMVVSLKTDKVSEKLADDQVIRFLTVVDDNKGSAIFTNLLILYPVTHKAAVVNIPGNIGAIYQSLGRVDRIDEVYKEKGLEIYKNEIENLLGCNIPFYSVINLEDFSEITDMLGGLRIFIPAPVDEISSSGERWLLPSGAVTLDGDKIKTYINYKIEDEADSEILERYQNVIVSFFTTLHDKKNKVFLKKKFFKKYNNLIKVNLSENDSYKIFSLFADMDSESVIRQTVTGLPRIVDGKRLIFPLDNGDFIKRAVKQSTNILISNRGALASRVYVLEIKNGTTIQGLAHNTSILFQNASYDVLSAVNADSNDYEKTVIIDHIGNKEMADMVGEFIHCTNIVEEVVDIYDNSETDSSANVDFTIILGKDFDGRYVR